MPLVYVSFGSFLSVRGDVLRPGGGGPARHCRCGSRWPSDPPTVRCSASCRTHWLVREFLPQVALLERAALAVTHGGNNSVTESLTSGVPMLVLPFSTDQFAGAAAIENAGVGAVLDPNTASADGTAGAAVGEAADRRDRAAAVARALGARTAGETAVGDAGGRRRTVA